MGVLCLFSLVRSLFVLVCVVPFVCVAFLMFDSVLFLLCCVGLLCAPFMFGMNVSMILFARFVYLPVVVCVFVFVLSALFVYVC